MFYVYILKSISTGKRYVGCTSDLEQRLAKHNSGATPSTRSGRPWEIIHVEEFPSKAEALAREKFLKSGQGRELRRAKGW